MQKPFYITTTLPYVNAEPHVGFAMEIIRADAVARYKRMQGFDVFFNTGTDEHGSKVYERSTKEGKDPQSYVDYWAARFRELQSLLNLSATKFIRTTDEEHMHAAQEFWKRCDARGDIYKKFYKIKYCVGCELEKTESELFNGRCAIHPNLELEIREEENYFFKFSNYTQKLLDFYEPRPEFVIPDFRFNETKSFVARGLEDFSISRLKSKMPWGVPVPGDDEHVMYVWFDALVNYISTLGWPNDTETFEKYWVQGTPVQYCGKDNNRQQSAMWQAMLMSAFGDSVHQTTHIVINGFINSGGQKMSKSLGNVINPYDIVDMFKPVAGNLATDVLRYYLLRHINSFEDSDMTLETLRDAYQANLSNGLGNLVSRLMKMVVSYEVDLSIDFENDWLIQHSYCAKHIEEFDLQKAMNELWERLNNIDKGIQETEPFKTIKIDPEKAKGDLKRFGMELYRIAWELQPFMPETAEKILELIATRQVPESPLFARLS